MKKTAAIILSMLLLFSFVGCSTADNNSSLPANGTNSEVEFNQPEDYAISLLISINPLFTVYADKEGSVLDINFMNDDAKSLKSDIKSQNCAIEDSITDIVTSAKKNGYFNENKQMNVQVIDCNITDDELNSLLTRVFDAGSNAGKDIDLTVNIINDDTTSSDDSKNTEALESDTSNTSTNIQSSSSSASTTSSVTQSTVSATSSVNVHSHSYSKATCTAPATCSCGATSGTALGHNWQAATCKTPKTCKTCDITEGSTADHSYTNGSCSVCGDTQYADITTMLDSEYVGNYSATDSGLFGKGIMCDFIADSEGIMWIVLLNREFSATKDSSDQRAVTFNGKTYYSVGAGMNPKQGKIENNELVVTDGNITLNFALLKNGYLIVTSSNQADYPVGMLLSSNENEFLTIN